MIFRYAVIREKENPDDCRTVSYGLAAYADGIPAAVIHDITPDLPALTGLAEKCNRLHLSILHMHDIVEDFLAE